MKKLSNLTKKIIEKRDSLRVHNLEIEKKIWKKITELEEKDVIKSNKQLSIKFKDIELDNISQDRFKRVLNTNVKTIFRLNKHDYSLKDIKDVDLKILKDYISKLLKTDKEIQIRCCTEPNKQGVDENLQIDMLNVELNTLDYTAHADVGDIFISKEGITAEKKGLSKRIDSCILKKDLKPNLDNIKNSELTFIGYHKFILVSGGHQDNQIKDSRDFIKDSNIYCEKFDDNKFFYALIDGSEGEKKTVKIKNEIKYNHRIFAGNTSEVIEWVKAKINNA